MTGIKPLLGVVLELQQLPWREPHALDASVSAVAGGWENASHGGDRKGMGSPCRAARIAECQAPAYSPRLCRCHTVLTSASRDGVSNEVIPTP